MRNLLLVIEPLLVFALGVAGNKVAETFNLPTQVVVLFAAVLLVLATLASRHLVKTNVGSASSQPSPPSNGDSPLLFLGLGLAAGLVSGTIATTFIPPTLTALVVPLPTGWETQAFAYDIVAGFAGLLLCLVLCLSFSANKALVGMIGYSVALSTSLIVLKPLETGAVGTFAGHLVSQLIAWCVIAPLSIYFKK